ncbi:MAG: DUF5054 domain-containing protein [Eubacterium sp.]
MKKVYVVSKTHLDLGFTDFAETIRQKYINTFIPSALSLANEMNTPTDKKFIWTTGSWILKEALEHSDGEQKKNLINALEKGNIVPHALAFTTHSELFDEDTFDYGLSIVDSIDKIRGRKTVSAKMTDVPGHTKAIVPLLARHGVKLLHIGVNGVSAVPEVPECFLWKCGDSEVVVIYSGDYGGAFKSTLFDEVLYFDHTLDNHGAPSPEKVLNKLNAIQKEFPDYEVCAGTLDDFAEIVWQYKDKLPVYDGEIGDTWIHGSASDPYKSAALRELMKLKRQWLADGSLIKGDDEYNAFSDALLCIGEHTCGMDSKMYFADYENYLKDDFQLARKKDKVKMRHLFRGFPQNFLTAVSRLAGGYNKGSYSTIEKSWSEQREYINKAVSALSQEHKSEAERALDRLRPHSLKSDFENAKELYFDEEIELFGYSLCINEYGGIGELKCKNDTIIRKNNEPIIEYRSYSKADYDYWFSHYARNMDINYHWGYADFGRPLLEYAEGKYPVGKFYYKADSTYICKNEECAKIVVNLKCSKILCTSLGAPRDIQIIYTLSADGLKLDVSWFGKDANRLTEAIFLHLFPCTEDFRLVKLNSEIDYKSTASMGGRNLHAVEKCILTSGKGKYIFENHHSPLISIGRGKILEYDNKIEDLAIDGISYLLYNNVWGTNFPLWYEENARFIFEIKPIRKKYDEVDL